MGKEIWVNAKTFKEDLEFFKVTYHIVVVVKEKVAGVSFGNTDKKD